MDLEALDRWAKIKGITVLGTGDFTHPEWFRNLKEKLEPAEPGLFCLKVSSKVAGGSSNIRFILTAEISCIYSKKGKVRKIHTLVFAPSFEAVEKINTFLGATGNLKSDGRPILGMDVKELAKIVLDSSPECLVIPAHAWTPWFSIFGSKSGFDSIEECFEDFSKYIFAIETGLSSDPAMNWRLSALDKITLISNSDSHSPSRIGREANIFQSNSLSYQSIASALKKENLKDSKLISTIEFFPEEGKYHFDGHRLCEVSLSPKESKRYNNICPKCGKPLTIGVLNRVEELADRPEGFILESAPTYKSLIPLEEIIADALRSTVVSKRVAEEYKNLIKKIGNEFNAILRASRSDLEKATLPEIAEGIMRVREGRVNIAPGYDGTYGKISIFGKEETKTKINQKTLF